MPRYEWETLEAYINRIAQEAMIRIQMKYIRIKESMGLDTELDVDVLFSL